MEMEKEVKILNLEDILPNRFQPRIQFNESAIMELAESIKEHGVIQPIVVRKIGDKYEIIAGERRYKASVIAGKSTIPAIITSLNDKDSAEIALIENVQRENLTPIEEAISYKKILDMGYLNQISLAEKLGKTQSTIANKIRLLNLADEVQEALLNNKISERHARSLLKLSKENQIQMLNRIIEERLTVRKTDAEIKKILDGNTEREDTSDDEEFSIDEVLNLDEEEKEIQKNMQEDIKIPMNPIIETNQTTNNMGNNVNTSSVWSIPNPVEEIKPEVDIKNISSINDFNSNNISNTNLQPINIEESKEINQNISQPVNSFPTWNPQFDVNQGQPATPISEHTNDFNSIQTTGSPSPTSESLNTHGKFFNMFNFSDMEKNKAEEDLEKQEVNMGVDTPKVNDTFMFNFNPLEQNNSFSMVTETPQDINSAETYNNVEVFNPTVKPSINEQSVIENLNKEPIIQERNNVNVAQNEFNTFANNNTFSESFPKMPIQPIEELAPNFETFKPYTLTDEQEFAPSATSMPSIEQNNQQYAFNANDISNGNTINTIENQSIGFNIREVVKELRECNDRIQGLGYKVELEELDLENIYQATFKINKTEL